MFPPFTNKVASTDSLCRRFYAEEEIDGFDALVAAGDLAPIREWLRVKIHNVGSLHPSADELCHAVTGAKLDPSIYVAHLNQKQGPSSLLLGWCKS